MKSGVFETQTLRVCPTEPIILYKIEELRAMNELTKIKVMIGNLIDVFETGRIRRKDMERYNEELTKVVNHIEKVINSSTQASPKKAQSYNNNLKTSAKKPTSKSGKA